MQEKDFQARKINPETWKIIFGYALKHKIAFLIVLGVSIVWGFLDLSTTLLTKYAIDNFMVPQILNGFPWFVALTVVIQVVAMGVSTIAVTGAAGSLEANLSSDLRREAFYKLQTLSFSYYDKSSAGYLLSRLTSDIWNIMEMISWVGIDIMWSVCALVMSLIIMFAIDVTLSLITVAAVPVLVVISVLFQKKILKYQRETRRLNSMITSGFNEGITGARTTKTLVREELNNGDFTALTGNMRAKAMRSALISAAYMPCAGLVISVAAGFVMWKGGADVHSAVSTVGTLNFFINIGNMMFQPIRNFAAVFANFQSSQAAAERVVDVLTEKSDIFDSAEVEAKYGDNFTGKRENWEEIKGDVEFRDVSFWYKKDEPVLTRFNLTVKAGEKIALVGATGGGKSTIVNLVCRFYEPTDGAVLIDGRDSRERSQLWLQSSLGYVLQSPHLFSGTVRDNIRYGKLDASDEQIRRAAETVGAHEFISALPKGYDTEVGEGGDLMSTGQKQLISFARAILADPKIFVLDEATSSIDTESERKIQTASETLLAGRTSFIIAHRLSTVRNADRILVIDHGVIAEQGTHRELMSAKGHYYELYTQQFRADMEELSLKVMSE
ncbi:MAG: ABC transporter ATP-binding protein/permease [Oscillospiraceae bacterium]|jgi:ATP-binding cassette subfamily B protein|nr:ABC transporter ATP-binding protein/permease [Oscillospiraceae bacterium]